MILYKLKAIMDIFMSGSERSKSVPRKNDQ